MDDAQCKPLERCPDCGYNTVRDGICQYYGCDQDVVRRPKPKEAKEMQCRTARSRRKRS